MELEYDKNGWKEYAERNEKGEAIHMKYSDGYEHWRTYNENGHPITHRDSTGLKWKATYNYSGTLPKIHRKFI